MVTEFEEGDHVVVSYAHCGKCSQCLSGYPSTCYSFNDLNFGGRAEDGEARHFIDGEPISMFFGQSSFATYANVTLKML